MPPSIGGLACGVTDSGRRPPPRRNGRAVFSETTYDGAQNQGAERPHTTTRETHARQGRGVADYADVSEVSEEVLLLVVPGSVISFTDFMPFSNSLLDWP